MGTPRSRKASTCAFTNVPYAGVASLGYMLVATIMRGAGPHAEPNASRRDRTMVACLSVRKADCVDTEVAEENAQPDLQHVQGEDHPERVPSTVQKCRSVVLDECGFHKFRQQALGAG